MAHYKDPAVLLGNILGEFKAWYTRMSAHQSSERRGLITCDKFPKYRAIIELTGRVLRENPGSWSSNVKRNIEVAFCVTGLENSECFLMLLDDPTLRWVWNAVKQLSTSSLPTVRRLVISLLYRFEKQPDIVPLMIWIMKKDQDFICRYYVALCITKSPAIAYHIDEEIRSNMVRLIFQEEYTKKNSLQDQHDIQVKLDIMFARSGKPDYPENMIVENARIHKGD